MDWFRHVNNYCERIDAGYWSEPVNALTNIAFLISALLCWRALGPARDPGARALTALLFLIGIGSYLFHTHAQLWALLADVLPIQLFILLYIHQATTRLLSLPNRIAWLAVAAFLPYAYVTSAAIRSIAGPLNGSVGYAPVALLMVGYALALMRHAPRTARDLAFGAALLTVSLFFRTIDQAVCIAIPIGTHFLWHLLNAVLLGWMILVLRRHADRALAEGRRRG